jgi:hypothetical protein
MNKKIALALVGVLFVAPVAVSAATNTSQLESLYTKLIALLTQELQLLKQAQSAQTGPQLVIDSPHGTAPYSALISLPHLDGTEAVDFGDGHSTGSNGCVRNAGGYCDLKHDLAHTYQYPGTYTVTLYRHPAGQKDATIVTKATITVEALQQR